MANGSSKTVSREPDQLDQDPSVTAGIATWPAHSTQGGGSSVDLNQTSSRDSQAAQAALREQERSQGRDPAAAPAPLPQTPTKTKRDKDYHSRQMREEFRARLPSFKVREYMLFASTSGRRKQDLMVEAWDDLMLKYGWRSGANAPQFSARASKTGANAPQNAPQFTDSGANAPQFSNESIDLIDRSDLDLDRSIDRSLETGAQVPQSEARRKEGVALKCYARLTGNRVQNRDTAHYRKGYTNASGFFRQGVADLPLDIILQGIRESVANAQTKIGMFAYCLGRIHLLAEEQATAKRYAADERINTQRAPQARQEVLPACAAPFDPKPTQTAPGAPRSEETMQWHKLMFAKLSVESFNQWILPATLRLEDDVPVITTPNAAARDWLRANYRSVIEETLEEMELRTVRLRWESEK